MSNLILNLQIMEMLCTWNKIRDNSDLKEKLEKCLIIIWYFKKVYIFLSHVILYESLIRCVCMLWKWPIRRKLMCVYTPTCALFTPYHFAHHAFKHVSNFPFFFVFISLCLFLCFSFFFFFFICISPLVYHLLCL